MDIVDAMIAERERLQKKESRLKNEFEKHIFPEGRLQINRNGNHFKCFQVIEQGRKVKRIYIKSQDRNVAEQLALKKYLEKELCSAKMEMKAIDSYLKHVPRDTSKNMILNNPKYIELLNGQINIFKAQDEWANESYEKSEKFKEKLNIKTFKGDLVRSKSEAMIADSMYMKGISYRYECKLELNGEVFYPDFMAKNKRTGELFIWEHYGKMDDPDYVRNYLYKNRVYIQNGYIPSINYLSTYETSDTPLDSIKIEEVISTYLL